MILSIARLERAVLAGTTVLAVACAADPTALGAPCIDTNSQTSLVSRVMEIQLPGRSAIPFTGTIVSIIPATGELGLRDPATESEQRIIPSVIRLETLEPSMVAQMALPVRTLLGPLSDEFSLATLTVNNGVIHYPNCTLAMEGHEIAFVGTLTFAGGKLKVDGTFFDYTHPAASPGPLRTIINKPG